ncbi:MAG: hypothetical protein PHX29_06845 [Dehalococcoidales bacterium]|nr:hypothetical protein [Dehalococcoidales bacterium]
MNIEALREIGKERKGGKYHRIYFNLAKMYGLDVVYAKAGWVESAKFRGKEMSVKDASKLLRTFMGGEVWYNVKTGNFGGKRIADEYYCEIVAQIRMLTTALEPGETFLFQNEDLETFFKFDGQTYDVDDFKFSKKEYIEAEKKQIKCYENEDGICLKRVEIFIEPVQTKWYVSSKTREVENVGKNTSSTI